MKSQLDVNVFGITCEVISDDPGFIDFVNSNYSIFESGPNETSCVTVRFSLEFGEYAKSRKGSLERFGEGLYRGASSIYWENEFGFVALIIFDDSKHWRIFSFHYDLLEKSGLEERLKNYTRSMRWTIHFPIFMMLEKFQGKRLIHASAISKDGRAIVLAGLNKVGKSSLARYIYDQYNYNYLSDNFLLVDENYIYAFPEKGRLSPESMSRLNLKSNSISTVYGKHHVPIELDRIEFKSKPAAIFVISNSKKRSILKMGSREGWELIESMHRYLQEFPEYSFYSLLDSFEFWHVEQRTPLIINAPFYRLSVPLDWSLGDSSKEVLKCL